MNTRIQYLKNAAGEKIGVYLPIEVWEAILQNNDLLSRMFHPKSKKRKKHITTKDLPAHDLGKDFEIPDRNELYAERVLSHLENE